MLGSFLTVGEQVFILFILIAVGYICGKIKLLNENAVKAITDLVLYIVCPCVIIKAFSEQKFDKGSLASLGITALMAVFVYAVTVLISNLLIHNKDIAKQRVLRFGAIFSNCGFMALPLQGAILGDVGLFYGAVFVAVFNLTVWSYGLVVMSGDKSLLSPKKVITNPGIIGVIIGLLIYILSVKMPGAVIKPVEYFASLNTPVPMLVIGYHLSQTKLIEALKEKSMYLAVVIRLLISPVILMLFMYALHIDKNIMISCMIAAATPVAAITTMFSVKYNQDTKLSVSFVSVSTLISLITMPILVGITQYIA